MSQFDRYVMVDWSAASVPTRGRDSIWLGVAAPGGATTVENIATRHDAVDRLKALAGEARARGERLLIGFDFPFGYPAGVAERVAGEARALALWRWIAARLEDGPDNRNNRFAVAAEMTRHYPGTGPFWGRPASVDEPDIPVKARERTGDGHPPERRLADRTAKGAKTVWQLAYAGSVGSQVLTGLPAILRLRDDPEVGEAVRIWPFETGLEVPEVPVTVAEIYPSLLPPDPGEAIKDAGQVRAVADWLKGLDAAGELAVLFRGPSVGAAEREAIAAEEAWILGLDAVGSAASTGTVPGVTRDLDGRRTRAETGAAPAKASGHRIKSGAVPEAGPNRLPLRYERDPAEIYRQSFAIVEREARLDHLPDDLRAVAVRLVHACGMPEITARLAWSADVAASATAALARGAPVLCDCEAVASMVIRRTLPAANQVVCTLNEADVPARAAEIGNTRSAAAVEFWADRLDGAVVAIGNAPTALYRLMEMLDEGAPRPAAILGFPVGFVGAAESKATLAADPRAVPFLTLRGRRGGSAMAAAAVNALAALAGGTR